MAKRAMTSKQASDKKIGGHLAESDFAMLIGGHVNKGSQIAKKDVFDSKDGTHSVKTGRYWQIFLYRKSRLVSNSIFKALEGDLASILIRCLDAFPDKFAEYQADKLKCKLNLQKPMEDLCDALQPSSLREAFYDLALFNGGEVDYLSILGSEGVWHIFSSKFVVKYMTSLEITNSKAVRRGTMDSQKVLIRDEVNIGEIEIRNDSATHYREVKFRIVGFRLLPKLIDEAKGDTTTLDIGSKKVVLYGRAKNSFKILK